MTGCFHEQAASLSAWEKLEPDLALKASLQSLSGHAKQPAAVGLRIYTLGPIQIYLGEELLADSAWTNRKHLFLLLYLAAFGGRQNVEVLIDHLWPGKDAPSGKNNLNSALSNIRKVLKNNGADPALLQRDKLGVWLEGTGRWHDLDEFERCLSQAREAANEGTRQEFLRSACRLSRGTFMDGQYFDWSELLRQQHEKKLLEALLQLSEICLRREQYLEALEHSHRLLELDPCCQSACLTAMRGYLALSRAEDALRLYERIKRALQEELGIEPITALIEMRERALLAF